MCVTQGKSEWPELSEILYTNLKEINNNKKSETSYVCVLCYMCCIFYGNSQYDQIEDEMDDACSKHGKMRNEYKILI
jgi:hypothetical protein